MGSGVGDVWEKAKGGVSKGMEHLFSATGSPLDSPWFLPAALAAGLGGGYLGYSQLDKMLDAARAERSERSVASGEEGVEGIHLLRNLGWQRGDQR